VEQTLAHSPGVAASSRSIVLIAFVLVIGALYLGRQICIPLALAFVLSFLLSPAVALLERIRLGRIPSVSIVLILSFALVGAVSWAVARQLVEIVDELPTYKANLDEKIKTLHAPKSATLSKATATVEELNRELSAVPGELSAERSQSRTARAQRPVPVQVAAPPSNFLEDLRELLGPLAEPAETAAIAIIFTLFMLVKREDLRNRALRLAGRGKLSLMTQALDDAAKRLSRYLLLQFLVNTSYGVVFGYALHFLGIPHALLWGVFAGVLRFVPYLGTLVAVALPVMMALAVFPGWHQAGLTLGIFLVLELAVGNFIEPLLYGAHTGISALAILVAAIFWAMIWGPVGLILSTPLTVCLVVLGRHVPQLNFLEVVLGDEPVLLPQQCFYQRLLAGDPEEARAIAEAQFKSGSLESLYESVVLPALKLAELDRGADRLDDRHYELLLQTVKELIEDFGAQDVEDTPYSTDESSKPSIACIAAASGADELVGTMLAQLLRQSGHRAFEVSPESIENISADSHHDIGIIYLSSISTFAVGQVRSLCKKMRAVNPDTRTVIGMWNFESAAARQRLGPGCHGLVVTNLAEALAPVRQPAGLPITSESFEESRKPEDIPA
jgi:predicted PurR-regulated permease PerM